MDIRLSKEAEDVLNRYNDLTPWDKEDVCSVALNYGLSRSEVAEQWGLCEYSDVSIDNLLDKFDSDDILYHMDEYDVIKYVCRDRYMVDKVIENVMPEEIIEASQDTEGLLEEIEKQRPDMFNSWLREKFEETWCSRTEEEWENMKNNVEKRIKKRKR